MKEAFKLGAILALYAMAACFALALVNNFTAPVIERRALEKESAALKMIFPDADSFEKIESFENANPSAKIDSFYAVKKNGETSGYAIKTTGPTYDTTTLIAGFDSKLKIAGVHILQTSDSPGFGQKAADPNYKNSKGTTFYGQFAGVDASNGLTLGSDFEAISGATITSNTMGALISNAAATVKNHLAGGKE
ncbi:MAG: FMN-binding protein [Treponema sp.]|nr:FMN-binding protein [Treponema sp.]